MKKICISEGWTLTSPDFEGRRKVDLPHDFIINQPRDAKSAGGPSNAYCTGTMGKYEKYMKFGEDKHTILDIDGAYMCARIYFNDNLIDMHPHGYTPYLVDLSERVRKDRNNKIGISVVNLQPSTRWYSGAGVYRDVFLWTGGSVRIEPWDMFITTKSITGNTAKLNVKACVSADMDCDANWNIKIVDAEDKTVVEKTVKMSLKKGKNDKELTIDIDNPVLWCCENPYLYKIQTEIEAQGSIEDTTENTFGIRTISADVKNGFMLNGKSMKLKGGCIHHDHGAMGAAEYPAAAYRKISLLKSAGYNAVRIAHNPPSLALLEVCDRLGMFVMDEAFDMWNVYKNIYDYSLWFRDWWARDISYMVLRDRNHPCVISYSIGNEIGERDGNSDGAIWSEKLTQEVKKYDPTRLITSGICGMWNKCDDDAPADYKEDYMKGFADIGDGTLSSSWAKRTESYMKPLDIVGYNYMYFRYDNDAKIYPDRVIWGSESHVINFYDSWSAVMRNSNVIGDFTWTAYDNLGEAGTGRASWGEDDYVFGISLAEYPWRTCYQGDFDLCGFRRPQSYFRESIWKDSTEPHIFTTHPKHNGDTLSGTGWHWYDVADTWTFDDEYIGKPVKTEVYTSADEIVFILNGKEAAHASPVKGIATAYIPYEKGELTAVAIRDGKEEKSFALKTTGESYKVHAVPEKNEIIADNRDLCFVRIYIEDENGNVVCDADNEIECTVGGGELMAFFSGNPCNEDQYGDNKCHAFYGKALAIIRCESSNFSEELEVFVRSKGLKGNVAKIKIKNK